MTTLQAKVDYLPFNEVQAQPEYMAAPPEMQYQAANEYFDQVVATQPAYSQAPVEKQQEARIEFLTQYNVASPPEIKSAHGQFTQQQVVKAPEWSDYDPNSLPQIGKDLAGATISTGAGAVKGLSLGYLDPTKQAEQVAKQFGAKYYDPGIAQMGGEAAGAILPFEGIAKGVNYGAQALGRAALPATAASKFAQAAMNAATWVQSKGLAPLMARAGTELGLYEGLKSNPQNQFDLGQRAGNAAMGSLTGAGLAGAGGLIARAAKTQSAPIKLPYSDELVKIAEAAKKASLKIFDQTMAALESTAKGIQEGVLKATSEEIAQLSEHIVKGRAAAAGAGEIPVRAELVKARLLAQKITSRSKLGAARNTSQLKAEIDQLTQSRKELNKDPLLQKLRVKLEKTALVDKRKLIQKQIDKRKSQLQGRATQLQNQIVDRKMELSKYKPAEKPVPPKQEPPAPSKVEATPEPASKPVAKGKRATTRQDVKAVAATVAKKQGMAEFYYHAEGGRSQTLENARAERVGRDTKTLGGEDLTKGIGNRKEMVYEVGLTAKGDTAMYTVNESGQFRTRIIEGKGQNSKLEWIKEIDEESPFKVDTVDGKKVVINKSTGEIVQQGKPTEATKHTSARVTETAKADLEKVMALTEGHELPAGMKALLDDLKGKAKWSKRDMSRFQMMLKNKKTRAIVCSIMQGKR